MRLDSTSTVASSGTRPPSTTRSAARHAASKPEAAPALPIALRVCLRPAPSIRSIPATSAAGMSHLMVDSPKALGLATRAGIRDMGLRTAGPSPKARASTATLRPRSASTPTAAGRTPASSSLPCQAGPATYSRPSTRTYPRLSAFAPTHLTASKATPGSASMPARSSRSASATGRPSRHDEDARRRAHPSASRVFSSASEPTEGTGTSRLRRRKPTAFSTDPFSLLE